MADPTSIDYLGRESPLSLAEKPALPVGGSFAPSAGPVASGGTGTSLSSVGTIASPTTSAATPKPGGALSIGSAGAVTTAPPGGGADAGGGDDNASAFQGGGDAGSLLQKILAGGGTLESAIKRILASMDSGGGDAGVLDPSNFSLSGDEGGGLSLEGGDFTMDLGSLNSILPDLLKLKGLFDEGGAGLGTGGFSLSGDSPSSTLNPGDFKLGDTSINGDPAGATAGFGVGDAIPYVQALINLGLSFANGGFEGGHLPTQLGKAASGAIQGIGGGLAASATTMPINASFSASPLALFQIPQLVSGIQEMFDPRYDTVGSEAWKRRQTRSADAASLQQEILEPIFKARSSEDFIAALKTPVGGSTSGDALAKIVWNNLQGSWYGQGTDHNWLPDLSLLPLLTTLNDLGYSGETATEPTRGDVGGVGEIVRGGGAFLPPEGRTDYSRGGGYSDAGEGTAMQDLVDDQNAGGRGSSVGWDRTMRELTQAITGEPITAAQPFDQRSGYGTHPGVVQGAGVDGTPGFFNAPADNVAPEYLAALDAFDPAVAARVRDALARQADQDMVNTFTAGGGGTG